MLVLYTLSVSADIPPTCYVYGQLDNHKYMYHSTKDTHVQISRNESSAKSTRWIYIRHVSSAIEKLSGCIYICIHTRVQIGARGALIGFKIVSYQYL